MFRVRSEVSDFFDLFFVIGLAQILEAETRAPSTLWWEDDSAEATLDGGVQSLDEAAEVVARHAGRHSGSATWVGAVSELDGKPRGTLSPRVGRPASPGSWQAWQRARHAAIDSVPAGAMGDLRFLGGLGEPAYWCRDKTGDRPDHGASVWEMKTRNRGEDFVQNRLHDLAGKVGGRTSAAIVDGLTGTQVRDEAGKDSRASRTPTGLRPPGPADNARAWCALWGLSAFPVRPVSPSGPSPTPHSRTAGSTKVGRDVFVGVPVAARPTTLARLRATIRSVHVETVVAAAAAAARPPEDPAQYAEHEQALRVSRMWLGARGIAGVTVGRKVHSNNPNAPEPWLEFVAFSGVEG